MSSSSDTSARFYGHEATSTTAARYITHLFSCPNLPPPSMATSARPPLAQFVAYALYRTQLPPSVTTAALLLLARLKARYPQAKGSSGHRLFIAAFMMASKNLCDDTYSNKSWCVVAQSMFPLKEINQMEREMLGYLEWHIDCSLEQLQDLDDELATRFSSASLPSTSASAHSQSYFNQQPQYTSAPPSAYQAASSYPSPPSSPPTSHTSSLSSTPSSTPSSSNSSPSTCETPPQNLAGQADDSHLKSVDEHHHHGGPVAIVGVDDE